jgi:predicted outer membrane repeat protein
LQGKAIYCSCNNLTIESSLFGNLSALEGGAIYLTSSSEFSTFTIRNTTFTNNSAMHGGAIKFQDGMRLVLGQNRFINNTARVIDPPNY